MHRLIGITCAAAAIVGGAVSAVSAVSAASAAAGTPPRAQLTQFACHSAVDPARRTVSVTSVMRPISKTRALSVRFELLQQPAGASTPHLVGRTGGLGVWVSPADRTLGRRPGDVWKLAKPVSDVDAPAGYRFRVEFRWLGAHGRVLAVVTRQTGRCDERELRPDVLVKQVGVRAIPGHPAKDRYVAVIANRGASASGPFSVLFTPRAGAAGQTRAVASLPAHATLRTVFTGLACNATSPPTVVADPGNQVDDANRSNNALTVACPAP